MSPTAAPLRPATGHRSGAWQEDPGYGVYIHIPFCLHRCGYCDFNTYAGQHEEHGPYVDALVGQVEGLEGEHPRATSVFFGGGTPTLLEPSDLGRVLDAVRRRIGVDPAAEVTVEANPETVDDRRFTELLDAGFNRTSIGVQSLAPHVLEALERSHSAATAIEALRAARRAGFEEVNADLIYGSPWERQGDWTRTLEGVLEAQPDHVSAYALTIEEQTPLATMVRTGRVPDVNPDLQAERHEVAGSLLGPAGLDRYEVSNWARPGRASKHNVLYWSAGDYLGLGAGAHGHRAGRRYRHMRLPRDYSRRAASGASTIAGEEQLDRAGRASEALMLGLRLRSGIHLAGFRRRFGDLHLEAVAPRIQELIELEVLQRSDGYLRVAPDRTMVSNDIIARLI